jgi:hypothetical protein
MVPVGLAFRPSPTRTYVPPWRTMSLATSGNGASRECSERHKTAERTGVPRPTVRNWRLSRNPPLSVRREDLGATWSVQDGAAYCYLLGADRRDGTVAVQKGVRLQIVNDRPYPGISNEILAAMAKTFPGASPRVHPSSVGESDVLCISHPAVLGAFPQHGADGNTSGPSSLRTGSSNSHTPIPRRRFEDSSTQTVVGSSTGSAPSFRAAASPATPTSVTSSPTCPPTTAGYSSRTASCLRSG